jgi:hypothetical protein
MFRFDLVHGEHLASQNEFRLRTSTRVHPCPIAGAIFSFFPLLIITDLRVSVPLRTPICAVCGLIRIVTEHHYPCTAQDRVHLQIRVLRSGR